MEKKRPAGAASERKCVSQDRYRPSPLTSRVARRRIPGWLWAGLLLIFLVTACSSDDGSGTLTGPSNRREVLPLAAFRAAITATGQALTAATMPSSEPTAVSAPTVTATASEVAATPSPPGPPTPYPEISQPLPSPTPPAVAANTEEAYPGPNETEIAITTLAPVGATATVSSDDAQLTPTRLVSSTEEKDLLQVGSIETSFLNAGAADRWPYQINSARAITINVTSELGLDVTVEVSDPSGALIVQEDDAQEGEAEILGGLDLPAAGTYSIRVSAPPGAGGAYAILVYEEGSYAFVFQGTMDYEDTVSGVIQAESDHVWHFSGFSGDSISILATPSEDSDLILRLFGPDGRILIEYINDNPGGNPEELISYALPESGFYSLVVGEFEFGSANYQLSLSRR